MKILVDLTYVQPNIMAGVTIYSFRLLEGFIKCGFTNEIILLVTSHNKEIIKKILNNQFQLIIFDFKIIFKIPHACGIINLLNFERLIQKNNIEIFFSPYINISSLFSKKITCIGVLHDAQGFLLKKNYIKQQLYNLTIKSILKRQKKIITISRYSKNDILKKCSSINVPIEVIYNSVIYRRIPEKKKIHDQPYILNVNTLEPYKNLLTLLKSFTMIKDLVPHLLVIKAKKTPYWDNILLPYIEQNNLLNRVSLIDTYYTEEEMDDLYNGASLFVSPSLMEGFGFTPIEAALHKIPVICSKEGALYETTQGMLNYYEPATDIMALKEKMLNILLNKASQQDLSNIANYYNDFYSIKKQAEAFIRLFQSVYHK